MKVSKKMYFGTLVQPHPTKPDMYHQEELSNPQAESGWLSESGLLAYIEDANEFRHIIDFSYDEAIKIPDIRDKVDNLKGNLYAGIKKNRSIVYFAIFEQSVIEEDEQRGQI